MDLPFSYNDNKELILFTSLAHENIHSVQRLVSFFKMFQNISMLKISNVKTLLNQFFNVKPQSAVLNSCKIPQNLTKLYDAYHNLIKNSTNMFNHIESDLITPTNTYHKYSEGLYNLHIEKLKYIYERHGHYRHFLELMRNKYYKAAYALSTNQTRNDEIDKAKAEAYVYEQLYRYEIQRYNYKIIELNKEYDELKRDIKKHELERIKHVKTAVNKYKNMFFQFKHEIEEFLTLITQCVANEIYENDFQIISQQLNVEHEHRPPHFIEESFQTFRTFYQGFIGNIVSHLEKPIPVDPIKNNNKDTETHFKQAISIFLSETELSHENAAELIEKLVIGGTTAMKSFLDILTAEKKSFALQIPNLQNLKHLAYVLSFISLQHNSLSNQSNFELNFKILYLAERIYHQQPSYNNNNKTYLSSLLSKNVLFKTKSFWNDVLELKLARQLEDHIKRLKKVKMNTQSETKSKGFFYKIGRTLGIATEQQKKSFVYNTRLKQLISNYNQLDDDKVALLDSLATNEMFSIIKNTLPVFASFDFVNTNSSELIVDLVERYKLTTNVMNYYLAYITVCSNTIKRGNTNERSNTKRNQCFTKETALNKILNCALPYLTEKDYMNVLLLNKPVNHKLGRKMFSVLLRNHNINNKTRLSIWKQILKVKDVQANYNYTRILQSAELSINAQLRREIEQDVARTLIRKNNEQEVLTVKKSMKNILTAIAESNGDSKYCQGMNYICELIYELTQNEEETFYIFLGLFLHTEYPTIFVKDLQKLKIFFFVFERLVSLFEPELFSYLKANDFNLQNSLPSWFVTLFISARQHIAQQEPPIVLVRILDNFILSGWKAMMKFGLMLLHTYEDHLMKLKLDEMMDFLINGILKTECFADANINELETCFANMNITNKLMKQIEGEYVRQEQINNNISNSS